MVCISVLLSFFILPASAFDVTEPVNFVTPDGSLFPIHSGPNVSDVLVLNSNGYGYIVEFVWSNSNLKFYPYWGTGGYVTNQFGFCYVNLTGLAQECTVDYYVYSQDGVLQSSSNSTKTYNYIDNSSGSLTDFSGYCWQWSTPYSVTIPGGFSGYANQVLGVGSPLSGQSIFYSNSPGSRTITTSSFMPFAFTINGDEYDDGSGGGSGSGSGDMTETNSWLEKIYNKLCDIFTFLPELKNNGSDEVVSSVNDVKDSIDDIANAEPSSPLDDDSMNEFENAVGEVQSTIPEEDLSNMMGNVDMSGSAIEWIYSQLEDFVQGNNKVFAIYMSIMSMSLIMFIFNKGSNFRGG